MTDAELAGAFISLRLQPQLYKPANFDHWRVADSGDE